MAMADLLADIPAVVIIQPWNALVMVRDAALLIAGTMASVVGPVWSEGETESPISESRKDHLSKKSYRVSMGSVSTIDAKEVPLLTWL